MDILGYQLYEGITSLTSDCAEMKNKLTQAYNEVLNATNTINQQMEGINNHTQEMDRVIIITEY